MQLVGSKGGYDFYVESIQNGQYSVIYWNIVPKNNSPSGAYKSKEYIEKVKGVQFPKWYSTVWCNMTDNERYQEAMAYNRLDIAEKYKITGGKNEY